MRKLRAILSQVHMCSPALSFFSFCFSRFGDGLCFSYPRLLFFIFLLYFGHRFILLADEKKFFQQRPKIKTLTPLRLAQQIKSTVRTPEQFPEADKPVEVRVRLAGEMLAYCSQEANALAALGQSPIVPLESGSFVPLDDREVVIGTQEEQVRITGA